MSTEEIKRRFREHQERFAKITDFNARMDMRQEFLIQSSESLDRQLAELTDKLDALSELTGEVTRLVLKHDQRIARLENS